MDFAIKKSSWKREIFATEKKFWVAIISGVFYKTAELVATKFEVFLWCHSTKNSPRYELCNAGISKIFQTNEMAYEGVERDKENHKKIFADSGSAKFKFYIGYMIN